MSLHPTTFEYLKPSDKQLDQKLKVRNAAAIYCAVLEAFLPDGPDKDFIIRSLRTNVMWVNETIMRWPDGTPRE